jgi:hypothetical protein
MNNLILLASGFIFLFGAVNYAYGESDFMLEMNNASQMNEKLTLFAIEGESYIRL